MKFLIFVILAFQIQSSIAQTISEKDFDKLSWLEGIWIRTNAKPGRTAFESWKKETGNEWTGIGVSLKGQDTLFVEKLKIIVKDKAIYYVADVKENNGSVYFKMTELTSDGFVCENAQHDFPKMIAYKREGNNLKATTSGNGKSIDFLFTRKE